MAPSPSPPLYARITLLLWLAVATVLAFDDRPWARPLAELVAPVRRGAGLSQSWAMFAPNPPRHTFWLEVEGRRGSRWEALAQPGTTPLEDGTRWRYSRANKFARGLVNKAARRDRAWLATWWCEQDTRLRSVRFVHARLPSSPPGVAAATGPIQRTPLDVHPCR